MPARQAARVAEYVCLLLMLCGPLCAAAAEFPPKGAVPISVPLYLDQRAMGLAPMLVTPDPQASYLQAAPVLAILKTLIPAAHLKALEDAATHGFLNLKDGAKGGVALRFDEALVAVVITIPSENKQQRTLKVRGDFDMPNRIITPPSAVSAYLNVFGAQDYVDAAPVSQELGRQPFRMSTDGALNIGGWVLENGSNFIEGDQHPWQRGDTRLVHDLPDQLIRTALGDLSYPVEGFQSFQPMLGLTVARSFDLQPYRISEPTGQTSLFLNSPSRVDIYVNDHKVQTLQLNSGPFNVTDFPVVSGSNNVKLVITDATGRVEVRNVDIVSDTNLLAAGLSKFAYNVGVISTTANGQRQYAFSQPVLSVFHRYGLSDSLTLGGNVQADGTQQMTGIDATVGTNLGVLRTDLAGSRISGGASGFAWQTQYQIVDHGKIDAAGEFVGTKNFTLLTNYRSQNFAPLGLMLPNNLSSYQVTARYNQQWSPTVNVGVGGSYQNGRGGSGNGWNYGVSMDKALSTSFHVNANVERRSSGGFGVFINLSWTPQESRQSVNSSYDSFSNTARTDWNYEQQGRAESISASAGVARTQDHYEGTGDLTYFGDRGQVTVSHDVATPYANTNGATTATDSRSELRFASALVYAGGHAALSRPVSNAFAIFAPDPSIADYPIGIGPQGGRGEERTYEATTGGWGPAVLPDLTPYLYRTVRVDASKLPPGYDAGNGFYTFYPTYRSGTFVRLGSDANVLLDGTLVYKDQTPVALQAGTITLAGQSGAAGETFFTNRAGRFRIEQLKPGKYEIRLYSFPDVALPITVPEGAAGPTTAGTLTLPVTEGE